MKWFDPSFCLNEQLTKISERISFPMEVQKGYAAAVHQLMSERRNATGDIKELFST